MLDIASVFVPMVVDSIWQEIVVTNITAKLKEEIVKRKVADAINTSLQEALGVVPGFDADIPSNALSDYFQSPLVLKEVKKIVSIWEEGPDINLLCDKWSKKFSGVSRGKIEILLTLFLEHLKKKMRAIPELQEPVFQKTTLELLSQINSSVTKFSQVAESRTNAIENTQYRKSHF